MMAIQKRVLRSGLLSPKSNKNNISRIILNPTDVMRKAIEVLDNEALRIVLVADNNQQLLGTITDGDIRRAIINHKGMDTPIKEIMHKDPVVVSSSDSQDSILSLMKRLNILQVPVVNDKREIIGLEILHDLLINKKHENPVFLMAGGFGTRLYPLTKNKPKPLLKVGSQPILERILKQFINAGFFKFYISIHYKAEMIKNYFGDGSKWGVDISYIYEDEPLGTAGALGLLPKDDINLPLIMMNGDLLTNVNFRKLLDYHNTHGGKATMCIREYDVQVPYGVIETKGQQITNIIEKPVHKFFVNAGIYILEPKLVKQIEENKYLDMPELLEQQINAGERVNSFPLHEYWLDIGRIEQFEQAQADYSNIQYV